jgi:hypothetical protein
MIFEGIGGLRNPEEAYEYLLKSAAQNPPEAIDFLTMITPE